VQIAVISDLHLGRADKADQFGHTDLEFVRFLRFLEGNFEKIVLLGDIYETHGTWPGKQATEMQAIRAAHWDITSRFENAKYEYVVGNHDTVAKGLLGAKDELVIEADGVKLLFRHGHRYDWVQRNFPTLPAFLVFLGLELTRRGWDKAYKWGEAIEFWSKAGKLLHFEKWAVGMAKAQQTDVVVTGHTHVPKVQEYEDRLYLNSGACHMGGISWLAIDTKKGTYQHHRSW
jgi:predicted phosphodiesterase